MENETPTTEDKKKVEGTRFELTNELDAMGSLMLIYLEKVEQLTKEERMLFTKYFEYISKPHFRLVGGETGDGSTLGSELYRDGEVVYGSGPSGGGQ